MKTYNIYSGKKILFGLRTFVQKYNMKYAVRTSMSDYREQEWMVNFPLYDIGNLNQYYRCQDEKIG